MHACQPAGRAPIEPSGGYEGIAEAAAAAAAAPSTPLSPAGDEGAALTALGSAPDEVTGMGQAVVAAWGAVAACAAVGWAEA